MSQPNDTISNETDGTTTAAPTSQPGPDLLAERTLTGIFVHLFAIPTWFVGPGVVYVVSDHDFTRANAKNALNWHLFHFAVTFGAAVLFGVAFLTDTLLPDVAGGAAFAVAIVAFSGIAAVGVLTLVFAFVATWKAIMGEAWAYPIAPDIYSHGRLGPHGANNWWAGIVLYVLVAPVSFASLLWLALSDGTESDWAVLVAVVLLLVGMVTAVFALAALYRDARDLGSSEAAWQPNWLAYLAVPVGFGVVTYVLASAQFQSANPSGDAVYASMVALWLTGLVYLYRRRAHTPVED